MSEQNKKLSGNFQILHIVLQKAHKQQFSRACLSVDCIVFVFLCLHLNCTSKEFNAYFRLNHLKTQSLYMQKCSHTYRQMAGLLPLKDKDERCRKEEEQKKRTRPGGQDCNQHISEPKVISTYHHTKSHLYLSPCHSLHVDKSAWTDIINPRSAKHY